MDLLTLLWVVGMPVDIAVFGYLQGRANKRFDSHESDKKPPFFLGAACCMLWPLMFLAGAIGFLYLFSVGRGTEKGIVLNERMHTLEATNKQLVDYQREIHAMMQRTGLDPANPEHRKALAEATIAEAVAEPKERHLDLSKSHNDLPPYVQSLAEILAETDGFAVRMPNFTQGPRDE